MMKPISIYDTGALYEQHLSQESQAAFAEFYKNIFSGCHIQTIHDCSVGAGGSTLPLAKLGYAISGSDLNENLLKRAKINFEDHGVSAELFLSDFTRIDKALRRKVDCIISTGNSLPHVNLDGFKQFLKASSSILNDDGYLFFDIRNWDAIVEEHPVMRGIDPKMMTAEEHRSVYLLFNWHDDGSVSFIFATCIDRNGRHERIDLLEAPVYDPLLRRDIESCLEDAGYKLIRYIDMDYIWLANGMESEKVGDFERDFHTVQWYGVFAQKRDV